MATLARVETHAAAWTSKGERTRALILDTALRLFRERGYAETTMRVIADAAGISLGSSYYYFPSKEHLVQAFYDRTHQEHLAACEPILAASRDLRTRLLGVMHAKLDTAAPYHHLSGVLFATAADPRSPLNPFSEPSRPTREEATQLFAEVVRGSDARISRSLGEELPRLLWTYHMGVILFWIYDFSPGHRRTHRLVDDSVDLIVRAIGLSGLPLLRPMRTRALRLVHDLLENGAPEA